MANLVSRATGNFSSSSTWALLDSTSYSNSESANTAVTITAASNRSSGFTPGAITTDAIGLKLASRSGTPTGTLTVRLWNNTDSVLVTGATCTINISDLPVATNTQWNSTWIVFAFAAPVLLVAGKSYMVELVTSSASQVNFYSSATTNWTRFLRTTTQQVPVAGDNFYVAGELTGAGAMSSFTVTYDVAKPTGYTQLSSDKSAGVTLSGSNLVATTDATNNNFVRCADYWGLSGGLRYFEAVWAGATGTNDCVGLMFATATGTNLVSNGTGGPVIYRFSGAIWASGVASGTVLGAIASGDRIGVCVDSFRNLIWFRKNNGNWNNSASASPAHRIGGISTGTANYHVLTPACGFSGTNGNSWTFKFDPSTFTDTMPTGAEGWTVQPVAFGANTGTDALNASMNISLGGTLKARDTSAQNVWLRLRGIGIVSNGGTLNWGTSGTPIPSDSTAVLEFDPPSTTAGLCGIYCTTGSTITGQGSPRTSGKAVDRTHLTADAAANATTLTINDDTGWKSGDRVMIAPTTRTLTQWEILVLGADAGASSLSIINGGGTGGGVTNAHNGTNQVQADIALMTRNVRFVSNTWTANPFINILPGCAADFDWAEFTGLGTSTTGKQGLVLNSSTTAGRSMNVSIRRCSLWNMNNYGLVVFDNTGAIGITLLEIEDNVFGNLNFAGGVQQAILFGGPITPTNYSFSGNLVIGGSGGSTLYFQDVGGTMDNNIVCGCPTGWTLIEGSAEVGSFSGNKIHTCNASGLLVNGPNMTGVIDDLTVFRCNGNGVLFNQSGAVMEIVGGLYFGNGGGGNIANTGGAFIDLTVRGATIAGDTAFSTTFGIQISSTSSATPGGPVNLVLEDNTFGVATGLLTAHATADIGFANALALPLRVWGDNNLMSSAGGDFRSTDQARLSADSFVSLLNNDQVDGAHKVYMLAGTHEVDGSVFGDAAPSLKMTPSSATRKLESAPRGSGWQVPVLTGDGVAASVGIRKSAAYNGAQPRLLVRRNTRLGIADDTVVATYSAGTGSWNDIGDTLGPVSADGTLEFYVDCDGTAGNINVDDASFAGSSYGDYELDTSAWGRNGFPAPTPAPAVGAAAGYPASRAHLGM